MTEKMGYFAFRSDGSQVSETCDVPAGTTMKMVKAMEDFLPERSSNVIMIDPRVYALLRSTK